MLINENIPGARPRGFHIPKLSQVRVLTRFYAILPLLSYLNQQVNGVFVFVVPTGQFRSPRTPPDASVSAILFAYAYRSLAPTERTSALNWSSSATSFAEYSPDTESSIP